MNKNSNDMEDKIIELLRKNRIGEEKAVYLAHELLFLFNVVDPKGKFYCWSVIEYDSENCRCKKQCKACAMRDKQ